MRNLKLEIEYDGTNYCGWQVQKRAKKPSIQEVIEKTLHKIIQEKVKLIGSGRTDSGVHALGQVANFKTKSNIPLKKLQYALNSNLPSDIVIKKIKEEKPNFHSRFSAKTKLYRYTILNRKYPSVSLRNFVYFSPYPLDIKIMRKESRILLGRHNFRSFSSSDKKTKNMLRTIKKISIVKIKDLIYIDIEADGFLYNMVRNIVGTLIELGRKKLPPGSMKKILYAYDRKGAGPTAPAKGLCLLKVRY
ncbi:MAG: tRNA pseudouridine(38-40) synthase TruA [Candidatus Omnitrophica bacterium]|nr:tRNA pseudouridine(38-40) synthase TruA [Candidatus Omnitrophota bacterium]